MRLSWLTGHQHSYVSVVTAPTCITKGYTTYTCGCGETYTDNYVNVISHRDFNFDKKCDYGCGYRFDSTTPDTPSTPDDPSNPGGSSSDGTQDSEKNLSFLQKIILWFKTLYNKLFGWLKK